jgi:hypothetical protein
MAATRPGKKKRKPARRAAKPRVPPLRASFNFTLAQLGADVALVGDRARDALRHAEESALNWVLEHPDRLTEFRVWLAAQARRKRR